MSNTSSFDEQPPAKPARGSTSQNRQRTVSVGYSLNSGANFYDIPASDAFNDLVERYIPPQERVHNDKANNKLETMVMNNMWRSVAKYARQQIVQTDPTKVEPLLRLWHVRLLALVKLGLAQLAAAEFEKLGDLDRPELCDANNNRSFVPFELRILYATLPTYLKYPAITLERVTMLAVYCKKMQRKYPDDEESSSIWKQREVQTYLVLTTHWIFIKDYAAAATTMELVLQKSDQNDIDVLSSLGRLYLQMGDIQSANRMFDRLEKKSEVAKEAVDTNKAFSLIAQGEWSQARDVMLQIYQQNQENLVVLNNLAICEIYLGNLIKGIEYFEKLVKDNPTSAGTCETAIMNMCILYELRYEDATEMKIDVMKQVARWAGDSFQGDCIRLQ